MPTKHAASTNKPLWEPGAERVERANISRFMRFVRENTGNDVRRYAPLYDFSVRQPEKFWSLLQCRALGLKVEVLDQAGHAAGADAGELACTAPFPSMPLSFCNDVDGMNYRKAFFRVFPTRGAVATAPC